MTSLVLDKPHYTLSIKEGALHCAHPEMGARYFPWHSLTDVIIGKGVSLSSDVLLQLAEKGVQVFMMGKYGKQQASVCSLTAPASDFKTHQYALCQDKTRCLTMARRILQCRADGQRRNLRALGLPLPETWQRIRPKLHTEPSIMWVEGQLSLQYWQALVPLLAQFGFEGRVRRPPTDPINAMLSLVSTLEDSLYAKALLSNGFDLGLGIHHVTGYRRQSLILDVKELSRAKLERWVFDAFLLGKLTAADFQQTEKGCRLTAEGQRRFYLMWFAFAKGHQKTLVRLCALIRRFVVCAALSEAK